MYIGLAHLTYLRAWHSSSPTTPQKDPFDVASSSRVSFHLSSLGHVEFKLTSYSSRELDLSRRMNFVFGSKVFQSVAAIPSSSAYAHEHHISHANCFPKAERVFRASRAPIPAAYLHGALSTFRRPSRVTTHALTTFTLPWCTHKKPPSFPPSSLLFFSILTLMRLCRLTKQQSSGDKTLIAQRRSSLREGGLRISSAS